jgi:hypothetical protein
VPRIKREEREGGAEFMADGFELGAKILGIDDETGEVVGDAEGFGRPVRVRVDQAGEPFAVRAGFERF